MLNVGRYKYISSTYSLHLSRHFSIDPRNKWNSHRRNQRQVCVTMLRLIAEHQRWFWISDLPSVFSRPEEIEITWCEVSTGKKLVKYLPPKTSEQNARSCDHMRSYVVIQQYDACCKQSLSSLTIHPRHNN